MIISNDMDLQRLALIVGEDVSKSDARKVRAALVAEHDGAELATVYMSDRRWNAVMSKAFDNCGTCAHESEVTSDGNGAYCRFCGETLA